MSQDSSRSDLTKIIDKKPNWIIRWGITILWGILILLGTGYYLTRG
jgi:hypothetical protein